MRNLLAVGGLNNIDIAIYWISIYKIVFMSLYLYDQTIPILEFIGGYPIQKSHRGDFGGYFDFVNKFVVS